MLNVVKLDNNSKRWKIDPTIEAIVNKTITTTMELVKIQIDGAGAIGIVETIHEVWTQQQIIKLSHKQ